MASSRKCTEGWTLDDGIRGSFPLSRPMGVWEALCERGLAAPCPRGLEALQYAWAAARPWRYACIFQTPEEDFERLGFRFARLEGAGCVYLNGVPLADFASGECRVDATAHLREGDNLLEVVFAPALAEMPFKRGIVGDVYCAATHYVTVWQARFAADPAAVSARIDLTAHVAGKYLFRYTIQDGDGRVTNLEYIERLRAARGTVDQTLSLPPSREAREVRLSIERSGVGCELIRGRVACPPEEPPRRLVALSGEPSEAILEAVAQLGADGLCLPAEKDRFLEREYLRYGLWRAEAGDALLLAEPAPLSYAAMREMAGEEPFWPGGQPVWRLTGSPPPDVREAEGLWGVNALGDAKRYCALARLLQAERLRARALRARLNGRAVCLRDIAEDMPRYRSEALIEYGGARRPAYWALKNAWSPWAAFLDAPESAVCGTLIKIPVWLFAERAEVLSVSARVYAADGALLADCTYPSFAAGAAKLGELAVDLPKEETAVLLRAEVSDAEGGVRHRADAILCLAREGSAPLGPLKNLPAATLVREGERLVNRGDRVAFALTAGEVYGALLPGEGLTCPGAYECLTGF